MSDDDKAWLKEWLPKVGGALFPLFVLAFLGAHDQPGSPASLWYGVRMAILPAAAATAIVLAIMWRRRS
jgi:hypothetical protein